MPVPEPLAPSQEERTWAAVAHLAPLVGYLVLIGQFLVPLGVLFFGPKTPFVQDHVKESLNGQISYTLYGLVLFLLALTVVGVVLVLPLGVFLLGLALYNMVRGALAAGRGEGYRYALILRLVP